MTSKEHKSIGSVPVQWYNNEGVYGQGIKASLPSTMYQIILLVLYLVRGLTHDFELFSLAAEIKEADKFDDLVFTYVNNGRKVFRFLQAKHKDKDKTIPININQLINEKDDDFSILKYFSSYRKIKENIMFEGELESFIICTNIDIDDKTKEALYEKDSKEDQILHFANHKSKLFKFKEGTEYEDLKLLLKTNHVKRLTTVLANAVVKKEKVLPKDFINYEKWVLEKVFKREEHSKKHYVKFQDNFLKVQNVSDDELVDFRNEFMNKVDKVHKNIKAKESIDHILQNTEFEVPGKSDSTKYLSPYAANEDINGFIDKLVLAVNQPDEIELQDIITHDIEKHLKMVHGELVSSRILQFILNWVAEKEGRFLTLEDGQKLISSLKQNISHLGLVGLILDNKSKIKTGYDFKDDVQVIKAVQDLLKNENKQILSIYHKSPLLSATKILQANINTKEDDFILCDLKTLQSLVDTAACPLKAFHTEPYSYLIIYNLSQLYDAKVIFKNIITVLQQNPHKSIILNIPLEERKLTETFINDVFKELKYKYEKYTTVDDNENNICDLTYKSRKELIDQSKLIFQGMEVTLNSVIDHSSHLISGAVLAKLIFKEEIEIGKSLIDENYREVKDYFIERSLSLTEIKHDNANTKKCYKPKEKMFSSERFVIVTGEPGMGKSTLLTYLATQTQRQSNNLLWIIKSNLVNHLNQFLKLKEKSVEVKKTDVVQFICNAVKPNGLKTVTDKEEKMHKFMILEPNDEIKFNVDDDTNIKQQDLLEAELFTHFYNSGKVVLLLDGFDEVSPNCNSVVLNFLELLKSTRLHKLWITTRPYDMQSALETRMETTAYELTPLRDIDQLDILKNIWKTSLKFELNEERTKTFVFYLLETIAQKISNGDPNKLCKFLCIPLHIVMIAMVYENDFKNYHHTNDFEKCCSNLMAYNLCNLYEKFVNIKLRFIYKEFEENDINYYYIMEDEKKETLKRYKYLSLLEIFTEKELRYLITEEEIKYIHHSKTSIMQAEEKTGVIIRVIDGEPQFIHRTFAEYFAADHFACMLDLYEDDDRYHSASKFLYNIWTERKVRSNRVLINFLNFKLIKKCKNKVHGDVMTAVLNDNWSVLETVENLHDIRDSYGRTPLHLTCCSTEWNKCTVLLNRDDNDFRIQDKLFGWTPLHYAVTSLNNDSRLPDDMPSPSSVVVDLQDCNGKTSLMLAVNLGLSSMTNFLLKSQPDLNKEDKFGRIVLHYVWSFELLTILIVNGANYRFKKDKDGKSILDYLYENGRIHVVMQLFENWMVTINKNNSQIFDNIFGLKYLITEANDDIKVKMLLHLLLYSKELFHCDSLCSLCKVIDVNTRDIEGKTALHHAAVEDCEASKRILVSHESQKINKEDFVSKTVAHREFEFKLMVRVIQQLLVNECDINIRDNLGKTALYYALEDEGGKIYKFEYLLKSGAVVNIKDNEGKTVLHHAVVRQHEYKVHIVQRLLDLGADPEIYDNQNKTALQYAIESVDDLKVEIIQRFSEHIDSKDTKSDYDRKSLQETKDQDDISLLVAAHNDVIYTKDLLAASIPELFDSVRSNDVNKVQDILEISDMSNVIVNSSEGLDGTGKNPLDFALQEGYENVVECLLYYGAYKFRAKYENNVDDMKLLDAVAEGNTNTVEACIKKGAKINCIDFRSKLQPLHLAIRKGHLEIVKLLLSHGGFVNARCKKNSTILHMAAKYHRGSDPYKTTKNTDILNYLLKTVDISELIDAKDELGETPLHKAVRNGKEEAVIALLKNGAKILVKSEHGKTPINLASQKKKVIVGRILFAALYNNLRKSTGCKYAQCDYCLIDLLINCDKMKIVNYLKAKLERCDLKIDTSFLDMCFS